MSESIGEARAAKRHVSRLKQPCRLLRITCEGPWLVTVRDISAEGIGLVSNAPFRTGMLLTIELPFGGPVARNRRLIRIKHGRRQARSTWLTLGCAFVESLTTAELESLRKKSPAIVPDNERRARMRHTTRLKQMCKVLRYSLESDSCLWIRNVSSTGVGLMADRPFKAGSFLTLELPGKKPALVRVAHTRKQPNQDWWLLGCAFSRKLAPDELEPLV
ncbi:hypothetical protein AYO40_06375 [Planctomycetaceae bacterium SCGC AG-212-D15]|nr:hypothetical protein AYO40_06375 [Planctomycetaceae bacterium SCGC AG-212-D15]